MKKQILAVAITASSLFTAVAPNVAQAADYNIDVAGAHASVQFKIKHLGYSWLLGRFNTFDGDFSYDAKSPNASQINLIIDTASLDSNHAERDKHLKSDDFLDVKKFPKAKFRSQSIKFSDDTNGMVTGLFTLKGITKTITFPITKVGEGADPWGGHRVGFTGEASLKLTDYGITTDLGPASVYVDMTFNIEGVRL
ncbi:YceI family protein [Moritella yayanosii]|uniref:Polyprenyl-pyrophosphate binding protein n=1 Tax=Moritella yayanosii TaxID=69539 RepID=A0A330LSF0_9GAMM|nr:YceI family protein [Moritella yayanosii]SQD77035.1 polyprenyl-pyrophosphate binding protein [Moritella yayanosii]